MKNKAKKRFFWILIGLLAVSLSMSSAMAKESIRKETDPNKIPTVEVTVDSETGTERVTVSEYKPVAYDSMPLYNSRAGAAACLRTTMKNRESYVEFRYEIPGSVTSDSLLAELRAVFKEAKVHTGVPDEGDYLEWHYARASFSAYDYYYNSVTNTSTGYFSYTIEYYTSLEEEYTFKTLVEYLFEEDHVDMMNDAEKILYIYNLLTENVTYAADDYAHPEYESVKKYTAYGALVNDWAVCQGIANAAYYMLLRAGIDCRMQTGANHAWIIVKYEDYYYYCDPTWDLGYDEFSYTYLMRGQTDRGSNGRRFTDEHFQETPELTSEFTRKYPIAPMGIDLPGQIFVPEHIDAPRVQSITKYYGTPGNIEECGGLMIRWNKPEYANAYRIYRKVDSGSYSLYVNEYAEEEYIDWGVAYGKKYSYVIMPLYIGAQKIVAGDKSSPATFTLEVTPLYSDEMEGTAQGLNCRIGWKQSQEASGYYIYRKEGTGKYVFLGGVGKNTLLYNDTNVVYGKTYTYMVVPFVKLSSGTVLTADREKCGELFLMPQPVMPKVTSERTYGTTANLSWIPNADANGYKIVIIGYDDDSRTEFLMDDASAKTKWTGNGLTMTKGSDKSQRSFTITGLNANRTYLVLVYAFVYTGTGQTIASEGDADWIVWRNAAKETKMTSIGATGPNSVKLTWQAPSKDVNQAAPVSESIKYEVYRSLNGTDFLKITTQSGTSFTDYGLKEDTTYYYRIVTRYENSRHLIRGIPTGIGKVMTDPDMNIAPNSLNAPDNLTANPVKTGIALRWSEIRKATEYRIYRKPENGSWAWCATVSAGTLTYTDTKAVANETYTYLLYAVYDRNGVTVKSPQSKQVSAKLFLCMASNVSAGFNAGKTTITWDKSNGASGYYCYRSVNGGSYKYIGGTTQTSYTDSDVEYGTSYSYIVVAYSKKSDGTIVKAAKSAAVTCKPELSTPVCTKLSRQTATTAQLTWKACTGANGYYVYRALPGEKYVFMGGTTKTTYTDKTLTAGKDYFYKVVAYVKNPSGTESKSAYSAYVKTNSLKPVISSITATGTTSIRLTWDKVNGAAKYYVYQSDGNGYTYVGTTTALSYTVAGLKKGTTYYYKITAVTVSGDAASEGLLSDFRACKTKS